jgi:hypothetical protein
VRLSSLLVFARRNLTKLEAIVVLAAIVGAAITLAIGGSVRSDTIRIVDASSSMSPAYGELETGSTPGYTDDYGGWRPSPPNTQVNLTQHSLAVRGVFQNVSTWTAVSLFKNVNINISLYPILTVNVNLTSGVRYGVRFYAQYPNGTEYNVWREGSPLDHRPGIGYESLRLNMQREAFLTTGHAVEIINKMGLYLEDPPDSPTSFQLTLSKLSFENYSLEQASGNQYRAIYFDLKNAPHQNASWSLNKINSGVTVQASHGSIFSIYFFDGPVLYTSTTASGLAYNSLTSYSQYTFYPDTQPQIFPELLPKTNESIVFVDESGTLASVTMNFANFVFLPTTTVDNLQQSPGLYYVYFIFFLFLLPVGIAILVFREFLSRKLVPKASIFTVLITGIMCRIALATTTAHVFDMNVYLTSDRGWFQFRTPLGSLGPTLPLAFFLYWIGYSPYALLQFLGFQDVQFLGNAAGLVEAVFVKLFPMFMDVVTFLLLFRLRTTGAAFVWATFYFLNPLTIFISSVWGQYVAATMAFIVLGVYCMSRQRNKIAALAFIVSGMVELLGFLPYMLLLLGVARAKLYKTLLVAAFAALPILVYPPETTLILRLFLGLAGVIKGQFSQPGRYSLFGNFPQLSVIAQFKPILLSEAVILAAALLDTYRHKMDAERLVFYTALSSVSLLFFSNLLASWLWLLPICLLYAIMNEKNDLGAFMLVFGTSVAFLEVSNTTGSAYLILGNLGYAILPSIEATRNRLEIFSVMMSALAIILLFFLRYGSGQAKETMLRTSGITFSLYLLLYFWFGVY